MDKCTHAVRKQRWKNIIGQCLQRPEGMTVKQWLDENNICKQTYYNLRPYYYFRYILTELPKHCDEKGNIDPAELDYLMPWSENLPEECRKPRRS